MSQDNQELVEMLRTEFRAGFGLVVGAIGETNWRIDQTNQRLDTTNHRLDTTNQRLDHLDQKLDDLSQTIGEKLDGIASYLLVLDRNSDKFENRLFKLEGRVDKIERDQSA